MTAESNREELLIQLLSGELDPESEKGFKILQEDDVLHKEYLEIQSLKTSLDAMAIVESNEIRALPKKLPSSDIVEKSLTQIWAKEKPKASMGRILSVIAMAAAVFVFLITYWEPGEIHKKSLQYYDSSFTIKVSPDTIGKVNQYKFHWDFDAPPGGGFNLYLDTRGKGKKLELVWQGFKNEWIPSDKRLASMPDVIYWQVEAFDASNEPTDYSAIVCSMRHSD